jgi:hypothetical protein
VSTLLGICFAWNQKGLALERHDEAMRPSVHDACLFRAWVSLASGPPADPTPAIEGSCPIFGALGGGAGDILGIARLQRVQAIASGAEMRDL